MKRIKMYFKWNHKILQKLGVYEVKHLSWIFVPLLPCQNNQEAN